MSCIKYIKTRYKHFHPRQRHPLKAPVTLDGKNWVPFLKITWEGFNIFAIGHNFPA